MLSTRFSPQGLCAWATAVFAGFVGVLANPGDALAQRETPTSYGEVATVDTPILRIPPIQDAPTIDGVMQPGEWETSSALGPFWYDMSQAKFVNMASHHTQVVVHAAYDRENLYLAYLSNTYPEDSWLKAKARVPDVVSHPSYGLQWDDHIELELRPHPDNTRGFQRGLFKWFINPFNTTSDLFWSIQGGERKSYGSKLTARSGVESGRWVLELAIPLESFVHNNYAGEDEDGNTIVPLPVPDGTAYRAWFTRGIGGNGTYFNVFDNHVWNTTKTKLIFDSQAPSFQINRIGPIMDDIIDVELTINNHNVQAAGVRSKTVQVGFFVESEEGTIYSSFDSPELNNGLVELVPGQVKTLRLRKPFPGVSREGNVLWFDVRSAGRPAKTLFRTRLIRFHRMDGGTVDGESYRARRLDAIEEMRPPRQPFDFRYQYSPYTKKFAAIVDKGIHGADPEAKTAVEARVLVQEKSLDEDLVVEGRTQFHHDFATLILNADKFVHGEQYFATVLLFDKDKRIVGERTTAPFLYYEYDYINNKVGLNDVVWDPFTPMQVNSQGFSTLKHRFTIADSGLPAQIHIKHDERELPLELRNAGSASIDEELLEHLGRGKQLRAPMRIEAVVDGERVPAEVVKPAELVRQWKSELEYQSELNAAGIPIKMTVQYDCDGSMHCSFDYGSDQAVSIDSLEMVMDAAGHVDMHLTTAMGGGGMASADIWKLDLPMEQGVVFDNADLDQAELFYSKFVPWMWFGTGDRAFTWFSDTDKGWYLDREGTVMTLERNEDMQVTWRTRFVNHPSEVQGEKNVKFSILTHPAKPKPENWRKWAWFHRNTWADEYMTNHVRMTNEELAGGAKRYKEANETGGPPLHRFYTILGSTSMPQSDKDLDVRDTNPMFFDQNYEDRLAFHFARQARVGRRHGFWYDETWPVKRNRSLVLGETYLRDKEEVGPNELPWQASFDTTHMRRFQKRFARVLAEEGIPQRNVYWANNSATAFEPFGWDTQLVEDAGAGNRSYDIDNLTTYPSSLYRYFAHQYTGLIPRALFDHSPSRPGDNLALDRQITGRAVLHDIGVSNGPHGSPAQGNFEQSVELAEILIDFGYFAGDGQTQAMYYWRNDAPAQYGEEPQPDMNGVYATVYRRPKDDGNGYKALVVVLNESFDDQTQPLKLDLQRVLGGPNTLTAAKASDMMGKALGDQSMAGQWMQQATDRSDQPVLLDLEAGTLVQQRNAEAYGPGQYGPVHIQSHDYRLFYLESE